MKLFLLAVLIYLIPLMTIIDYFSFKNRFDGPTKWYYYLIPCALEILMFICGIYIGGITNGFN